ncbi:hypothetical protein [Mesorhizobium sp. M0058]|uniref:hypothetical protein n=1 Tax=Mesorhizobium sp. M0058 TaxID=2956865 RepID=UPI00333AF869
MSLVTMTDDLYKQSGFTGLRLQALASVAALGLPEYAGAEHQTYFRERFRQTLETLDSEGVCDVVGFIAAQRGIKPEPVENAI